MTTDNDKVFVLSFHRSGTQSTHEFLNSAGYRSIHNPSGRSALNFQHEWLGREMDLDFIFDSLIKKTEDNYDAIGDNPMAALFEQAYRKFPDAKYILTVRNPQNWLNSVRKHIGDRELVPAEKVQYWKFLDSTPLKINDLSDDELKKACLRHQSETIEFFRDNNSLDKLCVINLEESKGFNGQKLANFLGVQNRSMPHVDKKGVTGIQ